jgi:hypothetical protein
MTNLDIDFNKKLEQEDWDKLLTPDFFELSKENVPCLVESSPYYIIHKGRDLEKALIKGKGTTGDFVSTTYLLFPAGQISDIPSIKTESNFNVIHSMEELNEFWDNKIKKAEEELELQKRRKEYAIKSAEKIKLPETNPDGFTRKTSLKEIKNVSNRK